MPRYVILAHDWPEPHWDFLLEASGVLRAWRLLGEPKPGASVPAEPNFDHRLLYLDYEGPLSGGRGSVTRWDAGTFEWVENGPERVVVELSGRRLCGSVELESKAGNWVARILPAQSPKVRTRCV
jgi:hypothetical protein